jgi:ribonuclease HII
MKEIICGVDEAGRGPVIGPLVIAGVTVHNEKTLESWGLKDSKKLTPVKRYILSKKIIDNVLSFEVLIIKANDIDDMRKVMTLNEIEVHAFSKIIKKLRPTRCFVDAADVNAERFGKDIAKSFSNPPEIISKHKADDMYPIVSAASIIAKIRRDQEVKIIEETLQKRLNRPLGSGYPADPITQQFLSEWVEKYHTLPPHTRKSWKTSKKILSNRNRRTLDDF